MEDLRALEALEQYTSRDSVEALIRETAGMDITFKRYPKEHDFLLRLRGRVNREISLNAERTAAGYCSHVTVPQGVFRPVPGLNRSTGLKPDLYFPYYGIMYP